jgi:dTMP kinase
MSLGSEKGFYVVFEGIPKCGKTTQVRLLTEKLREKYGKEQVMTTREPGGTYIAEDIRRVVQEKDYGDEPMDPVTEAYLYAASRAQSLRDLVKPALDKGRIVVADRSYISSVVFQGWGRDLGIDRVLKINEEAINGLKPDLAIFLDTPISEVRKRELDLVGDKFERLGMDFFEKVRQGYLYLMSAGMLGLVMVDGEGSIDEVHQRIMSVVSDKSI